MRAAISCGAFTVSIAVRVRRLRSEFLEVNYRHSDFVPSSLEGEGMVEIRISTVARLAPNNTLHPTSPPPRLSRSGRAAGERERWADGGAQQGAAAAVAQRVLINLW